MSSRRIVLALGGHALARSDMAPPAEQQAAVEGAMEQVAELIAAGHEIAITHGNGPQVGNLMLKNRFARNIVPAVPLDWCVAQTQATLGYLITTALERSLARRDVRRSIAVLLTRVLVDGADPAFQNPSKPIGRERTLVASPKPKRILDEDPILRLLDDGAVVVAAGGGGVPMVLEDGGLHGVEAVIDKDRCAALLALRAGAQTLVIATDVPGVAVAHGTPDERWLERVGADELRSLVAGGELDPGSMGAKVEACLEFVDGGGGRAVIAPLARLVEAVGGRAGTVIERPGA